jgi:uncharacterized protein (DUF1800 family)
VANATADEVSLLYGRAAFGATKNDLTVGTQLPYNRLVNDLVVPATPAPLPQPDDARRTQLESGTTDLLALQRWWLNRMAMTTVPLVERMTLFWHTHFATGYGPNPDIGHLIRQNNTIRTYALGDLRQMLYALTTDGAMLYWLSGNQNRRGAINENYARELFELFTMGTSPQTYTETDIRQAAKALSGWIVNGDRTTAFTAGRHDTSVKTVFGTNVGGTPSGGPDEKIEYQKIVDLALAQPTTALFVAYKMVCSFAYVPPRTDLLTNPDPLVAAVADTLRPATPDGVWDIGAAMKVLLNHPRFRFPDRAAGQANVRSPIEITVHLAKILGITCDPPDGIQNTSTTANNYPIIALRRMSQVPFQPPNVGGWPRGTGWLSTLTTQARYDVVKNLGNAWTGQNRKAAFALPASTDIAAWTKHMGLGHLSTLTRSRVDAYLASPGTSDEPTKQNSVLFLLTSSPDWQVM